VDPLLELQEDTDRGDSIAIALYTAIHDGINIHSVSGQASDSSTTPTIPRAPLDRGSNPPTTWQRACLPKIVAEMLFHDANPASHIKSSPARMSLLPGSQLLLGNVGAGFFRFLPRYMLIWQLTMVFVSRAAGRARRQDVPSPPSSPAPTAPR